MNVGDFVIGQVALLGWREGRRLSPGCRPAMLGIAHVIRNRVDSGFQQGDWLKVLNDVPIHAGEEVSVMDFRTLPDIYDKDFLWLHQEVSRIYQDRSTPDQITVSADTNWSQHQAARPRGTQLKGLYYCNLQMPIRPWFLDNIIRHREDHPPTASAGTVNFYA